MRREVFGAPSSVASESLPTERSNSANIAANRLPGGPGKQQATPLKQPLRDVTNRPALGELTNAARPAPKRVIPREPDGTIEAPGYISVATEEDLLLAQRPTSPVLTFINDPTDLIPLVSQVSSEIDAEDNFDIKLTLVKTPSRPTSPLVDALFPTDALVNKFDLKDMLLDDIDDDDLVLA